jgi:AraC family transcriptional regulator of adaptative response / DNA-3-methyladenine glycosylase II
VSLRAARTLASRLVAVAGQRLDPPDHTLSHGFPAADAVAGADLAGLGLPRSRARTLVAVAQAVADGRLDLNPSADRDETRRRLRAIPGIGDWTIEYIAMRALADPDAFPASDLALRRAMARSSITNSDHWRPWRAYAAQHLWTDQGENQP